MLFTVVVSVLVYPVKARNGVRWRLDFVDRGRRVRRLMKSEAVARAEAARIETGRRSAKAVWQALSEAQRERIILAVKDAMDNGHQVEELLDRAQSLPSRSGPGLERVIDDLKDALRRSGRSEAYVKGLGWVLGQFARGREAMRIDSVSLREVEAFLDGRNIQSRSTLRARLATLFRFAIRRGWRVDNPCERLEKMKVTRPSPAIFTVDHVRKAIMALQRWHKPSKHSPKVTHRYALPWFVLTTLCGLRPEEAQHTRRSDIHFREGWIRVEAQTTKVRQRRIVYPRPEAMRLLKSVMKHGRLPLGTSSRRRTIDRLKVAMGWEVWPKDITRHTAASYWVAARGAAVAHVAKQLGHSERTLESRYRALVTEKEANKFWKQIDQLANERTTEYDRRTNPRRTARR